MTASSRINSHTDLNRIVETRGNITVEEVDLLLNEKNTDRQTHAHHRHPVAYAKKIQLVTSTMPQNLIIGMYNTKFPAKKAIRKSVISRLIFPDCSWLLNLSWIQKATAVKY